MQSRNRRVLTSLILVFCLVLFPITVQAELGDTDTVISTSYEPMDTSSVIVVNNVDELIQNIQSDAVIKLETGEYDLGETADSTNLNVRYVSDHLDDSSLNPNGAMISGISNLKIYADEDADVLLYSSKADDNVLILNNCTGITLENITLGHKVAPADVCSAGVFYLIRSTGCLFKECDIYGCGTQGFFIELCSRISVDHSYIHDCIYSAADARDSDYLAFTNCEISGIANTNGSVFSFEDTVDHVTVSGCTIHNNGNSVESHHSMFSIDNPQSITLEDCTVWNNHFLDIGRDCCTVDFDSNDGGVMLSKMTDYNTKISAPVSPVKPGYSFMGWYTDSELKNKWDFETNPVTANMTLQAKWVIPVTITASSNNAEYGSVSGGGTYEAGDNVTLIAKFNPGYRFLRWMENGTEISNNPVLTFIASKNTAITAEFKLAAPVYLSCTKTDVKVHGSADGSITATASGGDSGVYKFILNNEDFARNSGYFGFLRAGTYTITAFDVSYPYIKATCTVTIEQPVLSGIVPANKIPSKPNAGTAITITPPAAPKGYTTQSVAFTSSNPSVATVDANGNVTFLAGGKVTIITKVVSQTVDKKGKIKMKTITVKKTVTVQQPVSSISLNMGNAALARTQKVKLIPGISPATASNKKLKWTSSNPKVAAVSSAGVVTAKAGGTAVITCMATDGSGASASCTVNVTPIYTTGVKMSKSALTVKLGKTAALKATVAPKNTDFKTVTWASSNPGVAVVDAKGKVRAVAPGTAVITATTSGGQTAACTVTVP